MAFKYIVPLIRAAKYAQTDLQPRSSQILAVVTFVTLGHFEQPTYVAECIL
jgi:hypothetical protein